MYLMIQNDGVAPVEAFHLLGDSGTRHRDSQSLIGQFGSGNKLGIALLLRLGIPFRIYSGKTRLEFFVDRHMITEADGTQRVAYPVKIRLTGEQNRTIDCGWTVEMGAVDWKDAIMALREFVSNCIDCSLIMGTEPIIRVEDTPRAKSGTTRVYVSLRAPEVVKFYHDLGKHFLHFSENPSQVHQQFLPRERAGEGGPRVYRAGVLVRQLDGDDAIFDYNLMKNQIDIDECRNSSPYQLRAAIAMLINNAPANVLKTIFQKLSEGKYYEGSLDQYYLSYNKNSDIQEAWVEAWNQAYPGCVVANPATALSSVAEYARRKGHKIQIIHSDSIAEVAKSFGVQDLVSIIGANAAKGQIEVPVTEEALQAVDTVWSWIEVTGLTNNKQKPKVGSFKQIMDGESECLGYHQFNSDTVFIREDLAGKIALKTAIEEVTHYITGATDMSRDFQNFAFDMIVELCV